MLELTELNIRICIYIYILFACTFDLPFTSCVVFNSNYTVHIKSSTVLWRDVNTKVKVFIYTN